jgi:ketosteroid isomerase-like protein
MKDERTALRRRAPAPICSARAGASLTRALGQTEDLILGIYGAYRRQDLDELIAGMHPDAVFKPVPSAATYRGREEIRRFFEHDIHTLAEFDFRVVTVQEAGSCALLHGKNRIRETGEVRDAPIYWYAEVRDGMLFNFHPYAELAEARAAFEGGQP